jgi:hypothetical protein
MQRMLKNNILIQITRFEQDRKEQVQDLGIYWILDWHKIRGVRILIDHNLA